MYNYADICQEQITHPETIYKTVVSVHYFILCDIIYAMYKSENKTFGILNKLRSKVSEEPFVN